MTDWLEALRDRAEPLVGVADAFITSRGLELGPGREGIAALARTLDDYSLQEGLPDDDAFVEGAGAVLGLLLIEHLGGEHCAQDSQHRVRLGQWGFFDPFLAIEQALDADEPRAHLAQTIAAAEQEASGAGPIASTVACFARELAKKSDLCINDQFELRLRLSDGTEVDLRQMARATRGESPDALQRAAQKFVSMLPSQARGMACPWDEAAPRLVPRLVGSEFAAGLPDNATVFTEPVLGELHLALLLTYDDRARFARTSEVAQWTRQGHNTVAMSLINLAQRSRGARMDRIETETGPIIVARSGDGLDASRLLLPTLYDVLSRELQAPIVAAVPHRDTLLACKASGDALAALQARATDDMRRAPHAISDGLFEVTPQGPQRWTAHVELTVAARAYTHR